MQRPSIWVNKFSSLEEWGSRGSGYDEFGEAIVDIDNNFAPKFGLNKMRAYCACCGGVENFAIDYNICEVKDGELRVGWSEAYWCYSCSMNSRMRATWQFLADNGFVGDIDAYMPEAITPFVPRWRTLFKSTECSEFIHPDAAPGSRHEIPCHGSIQHEDLTKLSYTDSRFDVIVCQEVFEHIPRYEQAFSECRRVLRVGGALVFTIPFFPNQAETIIRASVGPDGSVIHHLPPEFHGDPMSSEGSLCFQYFGWDILDSLRRSGFSSATAHQYWAPWPAPFGWPMFIFSAIA